MFNGTHEIMPNVSLGALWINEKNILLECVFYDENDEIAEKNLYRCIF